MRQWRAYGCARRSVCSIREATSPAVAEPVRASPRRHGEAVMGLVFHSSRRAAIVAVAVILIVGVAWVAWSRRARVDQSLVVKVRRGTLTATLTASGTLRSIQSITYRSPIGGREVEIKELAPEGARVNEGDLVVKLETTDVERELERGQDEARQALMDLEVA